MHRLLKKAVEQTRRKDDWFDRLQRDNPAVAKELLGIRKEFWQKDNRRKCSLNQLYRACNEEFDLGLSETWFRFWINEGQP